MRRMVDHGKELGKAQVLAYKKWLEDTRLTPLYKRDSARAVMRHRKSG